MKYLNDGRKVSVIGKLNNNESIVQEIFVTKEGDEIPSGENFTVKSLHDEPVLSWKEKNIIKIEKRINKAEQDVIDAKNKTNRSMQELKIVQSLLASSNKLLNLLPSSEINTFTMFMTGTIEYLVIDDYTITPPEKMINKIVKSESRYSNCVFDSIKLLSVMGRSDGELEYRINQYSDGSGSNIICFPFENLDNAIAHIKERATEMITKDRLSFDSFSVCKDIGINFTDELINKYKRNIERQAKDRIDQLQSIIDTNNKKIADEKEKVTNL